MIELRTNVWYWEQDAQLLEENEGRLFHHIVSFVDLGRIGFGNYSSVQKSVTTV